jgi:hypothetical protein
MRSKDVGLRVAGIVFGLLAVAQVVRLLMRADVVVNGHHLPLWASAVAAVFLGALCVWLLSLSGGPTRAASAHEQQ